MLKKSHSHKYLDEQQGCGEKIITKYFPVGFERKAPFFEWRRDRTGITFEFPKAIYWMLAV
jgi:hypothetical protein